MTTVSVIMPVYNQAWVVRRAMQSLAAQTFRDFDLILVDDGSTDGLDLDWARLADARDRVTLRRDAPGGSAAKAINEGFRYADAPFVTWVSGDNLMDPAWLETLVARLEADPDLGAVYGGFTFVPATRAQVEEIVADERLSVAAVSTFWTHKFRCRYLFEPHAPGKQLGREDCYYGPAFLVRNEVWGDHEGGASHDLGWWLRVEEECERRGWRVQGIDRSLCLYLAHDERCAIRQPELYDSPDQLAAARERRARG